MLIWTPAVGGRDHECKGLSYDGHRGTDFRIRDFAEMDAGVAVFAAADGKVKGFRNGEKDGLHYENPDMDSQGT